LYSKVTVGKRSVEIHIFDDKIGLAAHAAVAGAKAIRDAIVRKRHASVIFASAASQIELLSKLIEEPNVAWNRVKMFHLDEYVGLPIAHPASFRRFLWDRLIRRLPLPPREYCLLDGEGDVSAECRRAGHLIQQNVIDVAFIGIGENCHLAFNDPPADFATREPYTVVDLDDTCRRQQVGEGWFPSLQDVPKRAITMSVNQIMLSRQIICTSPDARKANAVQAAVEGKVTPWAPASRLQDHPNVALYIDRSAASQLGDMAISRCILH
jgi:glucosamine-6-phosphate deaminase